MASSFSATVTGITRSHAQSGQPAHFENVRKIIKLDIVEFRRKSLAGKLVICLINNNRNASRDYLLDYFDGYLSAGGLLGMAIKINLVFFEIALIIFSAGDGIHHPATRHKFSTDEFGEELIHGEGRGSSKDLVAGPTNSRSTDQ